MSGRSPEQRTASDPRHSSWVSANAGTGKTHVLVDRLMRLLLAGAEPGRILCLTFTNAAAAEMSNRLHERLARWAVIEEAELAAEIAELEGRNPAQANCAAARSLFARTLEAPQGLRIDTIHGFCRHLLTRFPIEAGVAPNFRVSDQHMTNDILRAARDAVLARAAPGADAALAAALARVSREVDEAGFDKLFREIARQRSVWRRSLASREAIAGKAAALRAALSLEEGETPHRVIRAALQATPGPALARAVKTLAGNGSAGDLQTAGGIEKFLAAREGDDFEAAFDAYCAVLLTQAGAPRKKLVTKRVGDKAPEAAQLLAQEQARILQACRRAGAARMAQAAESLWHLAAAFLDQFERLKAARGLLDYEDLIEKTRRLLCERRAAAWVLYKLDGGLDHILIDEAQDTSPAQWEVIRALTDEFFAGLGARDAPPGRRSLFTVGDPKQSIFSFQGASLAAFSEQRAHFEKTIPASGAVFAPVRLETSYRSVRQILEAVDRVFAQEALQASVTDAGAPIRHKAFRAQSGEAVVWPRAESAPGGGIEAWQAPAQNVPPASPQAQLASDIAEEIQALLRGGVQAGEIVILVRRRTEFIARMMQALEARGIAAAGADRLVVGEHIAVMDLMALGRFCLLPEDDLNLAALLKSPVCGLGDEDLIALAALRSTRGAASLWQALKVRAGRDPRAGRAVDVLRASLAQADYAPPFEFFAGHLSARNMRRALLAHTGPEANDPLDKFLDLALDYERAHPPSLQGFLQWMTGARAEISRDMDHGGAAVRLMTVHSAKGLEADIVFLPDIPPHAPAPEVFFAHTPAGAFPLWRVEKRFCPELAQQALDARAKQEREEAHRLLYVAMSRARNRLYVCGYRGGRAPPEGNWHDLTAPHLAQRLPGEGPAQEREGPRPAAGGADRRASRALPGWAKTAPVAAEAPPLLRPSRAGGRAAADRAPASGPGASLDPRRRGAIIHAGLDLAAGLPAPARARALKRFLSAPGRGLAAAAQRAIFAEIETLLARPELARFFGSGTRGEAPFAAGLRDEKSGRTWRISGRIDRLCVPEHGEIAILDYKSGLPAPKTATPERDLRQMALYRAAIRAIWPGRPVAAFLLWTSGPVLLRLPDPALDQALTRALDARRSDS